MKMNPEWLFGIKRDVKKYLCWEKQGDPRYWICGSMGKRMELFLDMDKGNYALSEFAEKHGLDKLQGVAFDPEYSCTYIYFDTYLDAQRFVREWNKTVQKHWHET
jgi:hypothetical protein